MNTDAYLLALDLGTSELKVAVTAPRGEIVGSAVERHRLHVLGRGVVEQDSADEAGVDPGRVVGVACSSQWSGTVSVDDQGRPSRPATEAGADVELFPPMPPAE
jgi:sugar (pentulose or hexulose) kinase